jgi:arylsulfatase
VPSARTLDPPARREGPETRVQRLVRRAVWGALLGTIACGAPARPPSFVLVTVDTLRADRLHSAGDERQNSPGFDRLQRECVWFTNAYASSSWTLPSMASLFLSQLASEHRVSSWGARLVSDQITLVDGLRGVGYRAAMFTANRIVAGDRGFAARFDRYELVEHPDFQGELHTEAAFGSGQDLTERALAWIGQTRAAQPDRPFFAYLHLMEPHGPYLCPDGAGAACRRRARRLNQRLLAFDWELPAEERALLQSLYDADVARADAAVDGLLRGLDAGGLLADTWVVLVADHGELLGERDMYMHGRTLLQPLVHVPLLFRAPEGRGAVVDEAVSLLDVAPTILDLAGIDPPPSFRGRSLRGALDGEELAPRPVVAELPQVRAESDARRKHVVAVTDGRFKFLLAPGGELRRYDLAVDPNEQRALAASREEFEELLGRAGLRFDAAAYGGADLPTPTPEMIDALRRLGYVR